MVFCGCNEDNLLYSGSVSRDSGCGLDVGIVQIILSI